MNDIETTISINRSADWSLPRWFMCGLTLIKYVGSGSGISAKANIPIYLPLSYAERFWREITAQEAAEILGGKE